SLKANGHQSHIKQSTRKIMKILVLGGGADQVAFIDGFTKRGHEVAFVDYTKHPRAAETNARHFEESALDVAAVVRIAKEHNYERIVTACIDQTVLAAAEASSQLGLMCPFSANAARM